MLPRYWQRLLPVLRCRCQWFWRISFSAFSKGGMHAYLKQLVLFPRPQDGILGCRTLHAFVPGVCIYLLVMWVTNQAGMECKFDCFSSLVAFLLRVYPLCWIDSIDQVAVTRPERACVCVRARLSLPLRLASFQHPFVSICSVVVHIHIRSIGSHSSRAWPGPSSCIGLGLGLSLPFSPPPPPFGSSFSKGWKEDTVPSPPLHGREEERGGSSLHTRVGRTHTPGSPSRRTRRGSLSIPNPTQRKERRRWPTTTFIR